jgi:hypothetical protein
MLIGKTYFFNILKYRTIVSALSNLYGLYPPGSGYTLPDNVPTDKFLPPNSGVQDP